jgi:lipoprotein-anchoring transpeptidase ErfK/SrfK
MLAASVRGRAGRFLFVAAAWAVALVAAGRATAQESYASGALTTGTLRGRAPMAEPQPGQYGGGFIELLMTGRDPTPSIRPVRANPLAGAPRGTPGSYGAPLHDPLVIPADPAMAAAPRGARVAALPGMPSGEPIGVGRVLDPRYERQEVAYDGPHRPGTIVIDTPRKFLFLVQPGGRAIRYGIGVGRPGFTWAGLKTVSMKRAWPDWTPPPEMLKRRPDLPRHMKGGEGNPLGARALYLGSSLYRIHGTNEPHTIGQSVSSGCIRMMNEDVIDLYKRTQVGTKVLVI